VLGNSLISIFADFSDVLTVVTGTKLQSNVPADTKYSAVNFHYFNLKSYILFKMLVTDSILLATHLLQFSVLALGSDFCV